jgi:hypothetical protein
LRAYLAIFLCLLFICLTLLPSVHAHTTKIAELRHPTGIVAGSLDPISVTATVSYQDSEPGYFLVVGILNTIVPFRVIPGIATSFPDQCVNEPVLAAICVIKTNSTSGVEHLEFKVGGILGDQQGEGSWNLNMTAALITSNDTLVENSESSILFSITISSVILTVTVPASVTVSVDGVKQTPGPVQVPVSSGPHSIAVPAIAQVDNETRLRFDSWTDGFVVPNRTVKISVSRSLEAVYVAQYRLSIAGQATSAMGQGWHDTGSVVTISVADTEPMSGILGLLGGKLRFQAWYDNNRLLTNSSVDAIVMDKPHTLTVLWQADYTMPLLIIAAIVIVLILAYFVIHRRARVTAPRSGAR